MMNFCRLHCLRNRQRWKILASELRILRQNCSTFKHLEERQKLGYTLLPRKSEKYLSEFLKESRHVYCGFDPTANGLHLGNLMSIVSALRLQSLGHSLIFVIGGATARIGDPSGKLTDRNELSQDDILQNSTSVARNISNIVGNYEKHFHSHQLPLGEMRVLDNADWYLHENVIDFARNYLGNLRLHDLLNNDSVKLRLQSASGLSIKEFLYPVFQAYDWLHLLTNYDCRIQLGGSDQTGNIEAGIHFVRRASGVHCFGFTTPLLTSSDGRKIGKSDGSGNILWLSSEKLPAFGFYQKLLNSNDSDAERFLGLLTFLTKQEIVETMAQHWEAPHKRLAQRTLAEHLTKLVHGDMGLWLAEKLSHFIYDGDLSAAQDLSETEILHSLQDSTTVVLPWCNNFTILDAVFATGQFATKDDARDAISRGKVHLNGQTISDEEIRLSSDFLLPTNLSIVKIGKARIYIIKWLFS